jgi:hypothetical protein
VFHSLTAIVSGETFAWAVVAYASARALCVTTIIAYTQVEFYVKCDIFTVVSKIGVDQQFWAHVSNMKFNGNPFGGYRGVQFEYTDGRMWPD